jgi:hypothetical protein
LEQQENNDRDTTKTATNNNTTKWLAVGDDVDAVSTNPNPNPNPIDPNELPNQFFENDSSSQEKSFIVSSMIPVRDSETAVS